MPKCMIAIVIIISIDCIIFGMDEAFEIQERAARLIKNGVYREVGLLNK